MRDVQRAALPLFVERGFDEITVEEIARVVGTAASTIYRHFGTKQQIVLWDEHDVAIDEALGERLPRQPPLQAIRDAFTETLGGRYDDDLDFQLERIRFIYATAQVHGAAVEADLRNREDLTTALNSVMSDKTRSAAPLIAGCSLLALDVAIQRWQTGDEERPLADLIADEFDTLAGLAAFS